jgi:branched-chain amino acid transport system permease protein
MNRGRLIKLITYLAVVGALIAVPVITTDPYILSVFILIALNIALATSLHPVLTTGQFSLAHRGFMAIGAYAGALLITRLGLSFWLALLLGGVVAGLFALPIGYLTLRLRGIYFVAVTFALNEIIRYAATGWDSLLGGYRGLPVAVANPIAIPGLPVIEFNSKVTQYYLILAIAVVTVIAVYRLETSRFGKIFKSIDQSSNEAESIGINTLGYKVVAFITGCFFAGVAGTFFVQYLGLVHPDSFTTWDSVYILVYNQAGGMGSLAGPIVGGALLTVLPQLLRISKQIQPLLFGAILVLAMLFLPGGLVSLRQLVPSWITKLTQKYRKRGAPDAA